MDAEVIKASCLEKVKFCTKISFKVDTYIGCVLHDSYQKKKINPRQSQTLREAGTESHGSQADSRVAWVI